MTRLMLDGINSDAPAIARYPGAISFAAGYVDGLYRWSAADWALFPNSVHVRIAVFATTNDGHVLDCEPGNCTPAQSVDWVLMRRAAGADPTVYCNELDPAVGWPAVRAAFHARGVPQPHYWVANYDGVQSIPAGAVAKQYRNAGAYDLSVVADYWPGVDPKPTPAPPVTPKEHPMLIVRAIEGTPEEWAQLDGRYWHVSSPADLSALVSACQAAGVPVVNPLHTSAGEHADLLASQQQAATVQVTVDATQLAAAIKAAQSDPVLLAAEGKAIAHAEAVEEHNDTPAA